MSGVDTIRGIAFPLSPLPRSVDAQVLRERYRDLKRRLEDTVPQLDRLLFTLPGADS